ncbi:hypothetical protein Tco_0348114 [Tanacetum coccineum]
MESNYRCQSILKRRLTLSLAVYAFTYPIGGLECAHVALLLSVTRMMGTSKDKDGSYDNKREQDVGKSSPQTLTRTEGNFIQVVANNEGQGHGNQGNQARGRAFMLGAEEARQDPNIVMGMDWLFNHKAEIICHEKVVRIPLLDGKVLRVLGEKLEERARLLMSAKASDKSQE